MPTAAQIDKACKDGFFVFIGSRSKPQQVSGATTNFHGDEALPGNVHVYITRTGLWEEVGQSSVTITDEPFSKKETQMSSTLKIVDATRSEKPAKRNGKRAADGHTGLPSDSQKRAAAAKSKKGDATTSLKDLKEIITKELLGNTELTTGSEFAAPDKKSSKKKSGVTTVTVSRTSAKQGELPGVQTSKRKVVEIETLAEELETRKDEKKAADDRFKDAEENLIVSMKKHDRVHYSRSTWGSVSISERKESAKFKREKSKPAE